jgi:hypothetical protein
MLREVAGGGRILEGNGVYYDSQNPAMNALEDFSESRTPGGLDVRMGKEGYGNYHFQGTQSLPASCKAFFRGFTGRIHPDWLPLHKG